MYRGTILGLFIIVMFNYCYNESSIKPINYVEHYKPCEEQLIHSPVDIEYYNSKGNMIFPGNPKIVLDRTFYRRVNAKQFQFVGKKLDGTEDDIDYNELEMDISGIGTTYVKVFNISYEYYPTTLRLHVYSEHTLEGMKMDMEIQIMHEKISPILKTNNNVPDTIGLAVLFSVARNKKSSFVDDFIEKLDNVKSDNEMDLYDFCLTKSLDLNQFFNFWEPFYHYQGSGTSPGEYCQSVDWFVMKKVQNMSQEQLKRILIILAKNEYKNGNAKSVEPDQKPKVSYCPNVEPDDDE